jgi:hypothetical protein
MILNVFDINCDVLAEIYLPELKFVSGRTSFDEKTGLFYKGAGTNYSGHFSLTKKYRVLKEPEISYIGYRVFNDLWKDKFGIFLERYQPPFTDVIGACGKKEEHIVSNSTNFDFSGVSVSDVISIENFFKIYVLEYKYKRDSFLSNPDIDKFFVLLEYMVKNNWCVPWDKNILNDINSNCYITDVADIFYSEKNIDKFGTVYAFIYGLLKNDLIREFYNKFGYEFELFDVPFAVFKILDGFGINLSDIIEDWFEFDKKTYFHIIKNILFEGRTCASLGGEYFHNLAIEGYKNLLCLKDL